MHVGLEARNEEQQRPCQRAPRYPFRSWHQKAETISTWTWNLSLECETYSEVTPTPAPATRGQSVQTRPRSLPVPIH